MKNTAKTKTDNQRRTLEQISQQVEMALISDKTADAVKDCLKTIIYEAANEANISLNEIFDNDFSRVRTTLPKVIEKLGEDYGRGFLHAIHAIVQHDTDAFRKFYDDRLDQDTEDLANLLSQVMKHPKMPTRLFNAMADELSALPKDWRTPETILTNLQELQEQEATQ
jgi:hypothetical protein